MFKKLKKRPLSSEHGHKPLASVSNAIKTARERDLSEGISRQDLQLDDLARFGISGSVVACAFDPVQSLLAVSTDQGRIHVYGQERVEVVYELDTALPIINLRFVKGVYLVAVDDRSTIMVFSLHSKKLVSSYSAPGLITAIESDYSLDYLLMGLQNGNVIVYDVDRCCLAPFRIDNLQKEVLPRERLSPVLSIKWHPRDIGSVLITYNSVAVIYSFATGEIKLSLRYELPRGSRGGENDFGNKRTARFPSFCNAIWHPNGLNILTIHEDNSLVFWDSNTGTLLQARTLFETNVNDPTDDTESSISLTGIRKTLWLCGSNPEYTSLLICGGDAPETEDVHNVTIMEFGFTPKYSVTSYEKMGQYYASPQRQHVLPVDQHSDIVDIVPLGKASPYFSGCHDPSSVLVLLDNGSVRVLDLHSGLLNYKGAMLPPSLSWLNPKMTFSQAYAMSNTQWYELLSTNKKKKTGGLLQGGLPVKKLGRSSNHRSALVTGHELGYVRMSDASCNEVEETQMLEIDISSIVGNSTHDMDVELVDFASEVGELVCALKDGSVVLFRFDHNKRYNPEISEVTDLVEDLTLKSDSPLINLASRAHASMRKGFLPGCMYKSGSPVTCVKNSSIGFVAVGYKSGDLVILDRRGPRISFHENLSHYAKTRVYATSVEFSTMSVFGDSYNSLLVLVGTNAGHLLVFKLLPGNQGYFTLSFVQMLESHSSPVNQVWTINPETGVPCSTRKGDLQLVKTGVSTPGVIITCAGREVRITKSTGSKLAQKSFPESVATANVSWLRSSCFLSVVLDNGTIKALSIPSLNEISSLLLPFVAQKEYSHSSSVLPDGDVMVRMSSANASLVNTIGKGSRLADQPSDLLFNDRIFIPARPTVNTLQWVARGTKVVSYDDFVLLVSGPNRAAPTRTAEESRLAINVSPYNPNNRGLLISASAGNTYLEKSHQNSDEYSYQQPVRRYKGEGYFGGGAMHQIYRKVQTGIDAVEERGNDYATSFEQSMNEGIDDTKSSIFHGILKSKFGI